MKKLLRDCFHGIRFGSSMKNKVAHVRNLTRLHLRKKGLVNVKISNLTLTTMDKNASLVLYKEVFLRNEYKIPFKVSASPIILDLGANIGFASVFYATQYPGARILAFEPNPSSFDLLKKNISTCNFGDRIEAFPYALTNKEGVISFYVGKESTSLRSSLFSDRAQGEEIKVEARPVSTFVSQLPHVDIMKIDVEGAEYLIFEDLLKTNQLSKIRNLVVEFHLNVSSENSLAKFLNNLEAAGFIYNIQGGFTEYGGAQDLLVVCSRDEK